MTDQHVGAAVDIGSISVHLLVASVDGHDLVPMADESEFLRLGARVDAAGLLGPESRAALVERLLAYGTAARSLGAGPPILLGAEPMRRAADAARVVADLEAAGTPVHVLTAHEEASLTLIGVTGGRRATGTTVVVDIGGGSSEVTTFEPGGGLLVEGLGTGAGRLTARVTHDPPSDEDVADLRERARAMAATIRRPDAGSAAGASGRRLVAVGGTATNLAKVLGRTGPDLLLRRTDLDDALALLRSEPSPDAAARHSLNPVRARTLPAGAAILDAVLERFGAAEVLVSSAGLREGAILAAAAAGPAWRDRLPGLVAGWD